MTAPLGEIHLAHPGGVIVLRRARLTEQGQDFDVGAFRAPYGLRWHAIGTRQPTADLLRVTGVLEGATRLESDGLRDAALAALASVDRVEVGAWTFPVAGAVGGVPVTPTERGWRIAVALARTGDATREVAIGALDLSDPRNTGWVAVL